MSALPGAAIGGDMASVTLGSVGRGQGQDTATSPSPSPGDRDSHPRRAAGHRGGEVTMS